MTLEDAAKLVISGGLVSPEYLGPRIRKAKPKPVTPPEAA
jgi:uncharacterized membrane protein